jgi:hypothetical protein
VSSGGEFGERDEVYRRLQAAKVRQAVFIAREPDPREKRLPVTVAHRCRRAGRKLTQAENAYVSSALCGTPGRAVQELTRCTDRLADVERELSLADELMRELGQ